MNKNFYGALAALALLPGLFFGIQTLGFDLIWDDKIFRISKDFYGDSNLLRTVFFDSLGIGEFYRPLPLLMIALESRLFGLGHASQVGHLVNTIWLLLDALLVGYIAGINVQARNRLVVSFFATLLFAIHPAFISGYAFISTRFDLVMTFCLLLCIVIERTFADGEKKYALMALLLLCALFSKEYAAVVIVMLAVHELLQLNREKPGGIFARMDLGLDTVKKVGCCYVLPLAIFFLLRFFLGLSYDVDGGGFEAHGADILIRALETFGQVAHLALFPQNMVMPAYYPQTPWSWSGGHVIGGGILLCGVIGVFLFSTWKNRILLGSLGVLLLPILNILYVIPVDSLFWPWYLFFPLAFFFAYLFPVAIEYIGSLLRGPLYQKGLVLFAVLWVLFALRTFSSHLGYWQNDGKYFSWWMTVYPNSVYAAENYLGYLMQTRDYEAAYVVAADLSRKFEKSSRLHGMAAASALKLGHTAQAEQYVVLAIDHTSSQQEYGALLLLAAELQMISGNNKQANALLQLSSQINPNDFYLVIQQAKYCLAIQDATCLGERLSVIERVLGKDPLLRDFKLRQVDMSPVDIGRMQDIYVSMAAKGR